MMCSSQGYIKRTALDEFANIRSTGIIAVTIEDGDQLIDARLTNGQQQVMLTSAQGMSIRFVEDDVRPMGRTARGVRGMELREGDTVVSMTVLEPDSEAAILTMCAKGYGKRTPASDYKVQNRAGLGIITIKVTERNGPVVSSLRVEPDDHIMVVTSRGKVIRTTVASISEIGRNTQGVRIIRVGEDERVVAIERIVDRDDEEAGETAETAETAEPAEAEAAAEPTPEDSSDDNA